MKKELIAAALISTFSSQAMASSGHGITLTPMIGTTGAGLDVAWRFHERVGVSAQYASGLSLGRGYATDYAEYDGDLEASAASLKLDFFPFGGRFYITGGVMLPRIEANARAEPNDAGNYTFDGAEYSAAYVGKVDGEVTIADGVQPYLGMGWHSSYKAGFAMFSEVGLTTADAEASLSADGPMADHPALQKALNDEERRLKDDVDDLKLYPVVQLGVSYTF